MWPEDREPVGRGQKGGVEDMGVGTVRVVSCHDKGFGFDSEYDGK